jgi:DNA-binding response OmpR family regulator
MSRIIADLIKTSTDEQISSDDFRSYFISKINEIARDYSIDVVDEVSMEICWHGDRTRLPKKQYLLIKYLIENNHRVVRRSELLSKIWGEDIIVGERTIDVHIRKIRQRFTNIPIVTRKGIGYIWQKK